MIKAFKRKLYARRIEALRRERERLSDAIRRNRKLRTGCVGELTAHLKQVTNELLRIET